MDRFQAEADNIVITEAMNFANRAHSGQFRKTSGLPYITHPIDVLRRLKSWGVSRSRHRDLWVSALLHDTVEDCGITLAAISERFGPNVARIVDDLTLIEDTAATPESRHAARAAHLEKIAAGPVDSLLIKIADRICNSLDFYADNNPKYARTYFDRGSVVLDAPGDSRHSEMVDAFGLATVEAIALDANDAMLSLRWNPNQIPVGGR